MDWTKRHINIRVFLRSSCCTVFSSRRPVRFGLRDTNQYRGINQCFSCRVSLSSLSRSSCAARKFRRRRTKSAVADQTAYFRFTYVMLGRFPPPLLLFTQNEQNPFRPHSTRAARGAAGYRCEDLAAFADPNESHFHTSRVYFHPGVLSARPLAKTKYSVHGSFCRF